MKNAFDCTCGHGVTKHTKKPFPAFIPTCDVCQDCVGYSPLYKTREYLDG